MSRHSIEQQDLILLIGGARRTFAHCRRGALTPSNQCLIVWGPRPRVVQKYTFDVAPLL